MWRTCRVEGKHWCNSCAAVPYNVFMSYYVIVRDTWSTASRHGDAIVACTCVRRFFFLKAKTCAPHAVVFVEFHLWSVSLCQRTIVDMLCVCACVCVRVSCCSNGLPQSSLSPVWSLTLSDPACLAGVRTCLTQHRRERFAPSKYVYVPAPCRLFEGRKPFERAAATLGRALPLHCTQRLVRDAPHDRVKVFVSCLNGLCLRACLLYYFSERGKLGSW